jgi:hypothetical protein
MSSTKRGSVRSRADFYTTPVDAITTFLEAAKKSDPSIIRGKILDPCAGGNATKPMSYPTALEAMGFECDTIDIRRDSAAAIKGDYLSMDCADKYDLIITNPPFSLAVPIIEKALSDVKEGGHVVVLERLNFFGSETRKPLFEQMPQYCFVHRKRMSFTSSSKTDSIEYGHFVWMKNYSPAFTMLKII